MASDYSNTIFGNIDILSLIVPHLDRLSIIRSQRVNSVFLLAVRGNTPIQRRLGFISSHGKALDVTSIPVGRDDGSPGVHWNQLLDWLVVRCFKYRRCYLGPLSSTPGNAMVTMLPRVLRAAHNPDASVHALLLTDPPVDRNQLHVATNRVSDTLTFRTTFLDNAGGVTLGQLITEWARLSSPESRGIPVCIVIPLATALPNAEGRLCDRRIRELDAAWRAECRLAIAAMNNQDCKHIWGDCENDYDLVPQWTSHTLRNGAAWYSASMAEQRTFMVGMFNRVRQIAAKAEHSPSKTHFWPALASEENENSQLRTEEKLQDTQWTALPKCRTMEVGLRNMKKPYEAEFAGGVVLNRWDYDPSRICIVKAHNRMLWTDQ